MKYKLVRLIPGYITYSQVFYWKQDLLEAINFELFNIKPGEELVISVDEKVDLTVQLEALHADILCVPA